MTNANKICQLFTSGLPYEDVVEGLKEYLYRGDTDIVLSMFQYVALWCLREKKGDQTLCEFIIKCIEGAVLKPFRGTMTLTFGEVAESHVGMQKIGTMANRGFSYDELIHAQKYFEAKGCETVLIHLNEFLPEGCEDDEERKNLEKAQVDDKYQAWILVAKNGLKCLTNDSKGANILTEMLVFKWDSQLYNDRKREVQNKEARHNLNFSSTKQTSTYHLFGKGQKIPRGDPPPVGTTIPWKEVPLLTDIRRSLIEAFGEAANDLKCEGNMYYSPSGTGIGYHGDTERRKVIGVRLGRPMTIHYMWYYNDKPRGLNMSLLLNEGDVYCMSEKTVGTDWRAAPKKQYTLRHAAGANKYTTKTDKIWLKNKKPFEGNKEIIVSDIFFRPKGGTWTDMSQFCE